MSNHYEAPVEVRELEKAINNFSYTYGIDRVTVFRDFLNYMIDGFTLSEFASPDTDRREYSAEHFAGFKEITAIWATIMDTQIKRCGWYDPLGDLFMALQSKSGQQQKGQFFTPPHICDLMAGMTLKEKSGKIESVNDPTAGSGRLLLAGHHISQRNFFVAQDIDMTCCMMSTVNFLIHGVVGIVECINTITQKDFRGAWLINEMYYRTGLPTIRPISQTDVSRICQPRVYLSLFLDQESLDSYINTTKIWDLMMEMFDDTTKQK